MSTVVVWVLAVWIGVNNGGGPMVVDNIASAQNCQALGQAIEQSAEGRTYGWHCYAIRKAR